MSKSISLLLLTVMLSSPAVGQQEFSEQDCHAAVAAMENWRSVLTARMFRVQNRFSQVPGNADSLHEMEILYDPPDKYFIRERINSNRDGLVVARGQLNGVRLSVTESHPDTDTPVFKMATDSDSDVGVRRGTGGRYFLGYHLPLGDDGIALLKKVDVWGNAGEGVFRGECDDGRVELTLGDPAVYPRGIVGIRFETKFSVDGKEFTSSQQIRYSGRVRGSGFILPFRISVDLILQGDDYLVKQHESVVLRRIATRPTEFKEWTDLFTIPDGSPIIVDGEEGFQWEDGEVVSTSDKETSCR